MVAWRTRDPFRNIHINADRLVQCECLGEHHVSCRHPHTRNSRNSIELGNDSFGSFRELHKTALGLVDGKTTERT
jgi:hypothetical protein